MEMNAFFNVNRTPVFCDINGENVFLNKEALVNGDTGEVLGVVSPHYKIVTNNEVEEKFTEAFKDYHIEKTKDFLSSGGTKWARDIIFSDDRFTTQVDQNDIVKLKVRLWNGYDGKTSVGFSLMGWRQVCTNGMMGWGNVCSTSLNHWGNTNIVEDIQNNFNMKLNNYNRITDKVSKWNLIPYKKEKFEKFVDTRNKDINTKNGYLTDKQADKIKELWPVIMNKYNEPNTLWGSYNVLTAIGEHHTESKKFSHIFGYKYKTIEKLTTEFVMTEGE